MSGKQCVVDLAHLARYTGGDEAINAEVLRLFDAQTAEIVGRLQTILDARDVKSWRDSIHALKGASRGVGAFDMAEAAAFAEPIDPGKDRGNASLALAALKTNAEAVQAFIKAYLER
ncbi:MAG TPA: Hpt domain-containing protein [Rhizomicrobium sp.]